MVDSNSVGRDRGGIVGGGVTVHAGRGERCLCWFGASEKERRLQAGAELSLAGGGEGLHGEAGELEVVGAGTGGSSSVSLESWRRGFFFVSFDGGIFFSSFFFTCCLVRTVAGVVFLAKGSVGRGGISTLGFLPSNAVSHMALVLLVVGMVTETVSCSSEEQLPQTGTEPPRAGRPLLRSRRCPGDAFVLILVERNEPR